MEDLQSALAARGLTVSTLPEKGRCLVTTRDFSSGDVIISQEPYASVPNNSPVSSRCDGCFASSNLKKCSACQVVWYCGSTCQKSEWKLHRLECQVLLGLDNDKRKSITPSIRLMVKLYLRRKLQGDQAIPATATDNYSLVEALVSHMSDIDEKQLVLYAQMANLVNLILQWPDINIKEIAENFSKLACNAHTICDSELKPLGTGLYPVVSIINHSCLPNSVLVFEEKMAVVRAVEPIPKGTEVLISYIETAGSTATRQKALKEQYLFTCTCSRCIKGLKEDIQENAILEGYRCKNDMCKGFLLRDSDNKAFICQQCGHVRDKEEIRKIASEVKSLSDKASISLSSGNYLEASSMYKTIEQLQMKLSHSLSVNLMRTRETLLKILMELKDWRGALHYCRLTITVYQRVYPAIHPLLGLQYYTCGKLEWLLEETENAIESLTKAIDILRITHGTNTPFIKELLLKLEEARAEAAYKTRSAKSWD
ncbi:PREDICTED: histone-lysine N-methyltransferase ASHR1 isoform X2 [Nelumbo nucifera]|uniref:Histone-lysine N-methyltransferase ASHR1 isoform X2 n=2 Tax=Nelumbo nucifera TaxID=4432 RepID=A0A1U8Q8S3_NELNU|nr:PREDICTED: histone-lysine N-methyltransferase ASHR1 isoform X2 [Nelumbo nucifera]